MPKRKCMTETSPPGQIIEEIIIYNNRKPSITTTMWGKKPPNRTFCKEGCTCKRHIYNGPISKWKFSPFGDGKETYEIPYIDDGCEVSSKCVECPLSECRYVDSAPFKKWRNSHPGINKNKEDIVYEILDLQSEGFTSLEICEKLGISNVRNLRWKVVSLGYQWEGDHPFNVKRLR